MEVYDSEREQIEAMKKWWAQNGKAIITGLVLGLAALIGWQQWSASVHRDAGSRWYSLAGDTSLGVSTDGLQYGETTIHPESPA